MSPFVRAVGFAALLTTATALLVVAVARTPDLPVWAVAACAALIVAATAAVVAGRDRVVEAVAPTPLGVDDALDVVAAVAGAVVTYLLSVTGGLGPVVASALVGFIAGVIVRRVAVSAYCGSFVGMASPSLFSDLVLIAVAGLVAGLGLVAAREAFGGFGGKLGTLALFGTLATAALTGVDFATGSAVSWGLAPVAILVAAIAAVATVVVSLRLEFGAVIGSAVVGLVAGVALPALAGSVGTTLALVAFCASFVGMSTTARLPNEGHVALAGGLSGLVFVLVAPAFGGAGGKLGTVAFISTLTLFGAIELIELVAAKTVGAR